MRILLPLPCCLCSVCCVCILVCPSCSHDCCCWFTENKFDVFLSVYWLSISFMSMVLDFVAFAYFFNVNFKPYFIVSIFITILLVVVIMIVWILPYKNYLQIIAYLQRCKIRRNEVTSITSAVKPNRLNYFRKSFKFSHFELS